MRVVSLYAGVGGLDWGFRGGYEFVLVNEYNKDAANTYVWNRPEHASVMRVCDIADILDDVPDHDLLLGGFPCPSWSLAGKRLGFEDDRGKEFFNCVHVLKSKRPSLFVFENVKGLLSHNKGESFRFMLGEFASLGYDVTFRCISMSDYGVPQKRERVIMIGSLIGKVHFPPASQKGRTFSEATEGLSRTHPNFNIHTATEAKQHWLKVLQEGENLHHVTEEEIQRRECALGLPHRPKPKTLQGYTRLTGNKVAPTMMFGNTCLPGHPTEDRSISVHEAATIQGFPPSFVFTGGIAAQYKQVGNAVPPLFSEILAEQILSFMKA